MIYNRMVKSVLVYGAETWSLYEDGGRRINATEMDVLRRSARISKLDRTTEAQKIQRLRPGLNPRTRVPVASMLTTRPPKPSRDEDDLIEDRNMLECFLSVLSDVNIT